MRGKIFAAPETVFLCFKAQRNKSALGKAERSGELHARLFVHERGFGQPPHPKVALERSRAY